MACLLHELMYCAYSSVLQKLALHVIHANGFFPSWTNVMCLFKLSFLPKLASQVSHVNFFLPSWINSICLCKTLSIKSALQISHLRQCFSSYDVVVWNLHCNYCILIAFFLHELRQYGYSNVSFEKKLDDKCYIQLASFLHELMQRAHLNGIFCQN